MLKMSVVTECGLRAGCGLGTVGWISPCPSKKQVEGTKYGLRQCLNGYCHGFNSCGMNVLFQSWSHLDSCDMHQHDHSFFVVLMFVAFCQSFLVSVHSWNLLLPQILTIRGIWLLTSLPCIDCTTTSWFSRAYWFCVVWFSLLVVKRVYEFMSINSSIHLVVNLL